MASGLSNKLTGQIGEFLACAELGRRGFVATSFTGNVPEYDLLVCDDKLNTLPIQVKTSRSNTWPSKANQWLEIEIDEDSKRQINKGKKKIDNPDLIYISIVLGNDKKDD
jgi:Holliday junction resolvase-like predicted endonuclease